MRVFLSYRREDSAAWAGRLHDSLTARLGANTVFQDITTLRPGEEFTVTIDRALEDADAALAVIGPGWLTAVDADGCRRLDDEDDIVRAELAAALAHETLLIPVLVGGARMPESSDLPVQLRPLVGRHAQEMREATWQHDVDDLVRALRGERRPFDLLRAFIVVAVVVTFIVAAVALVWVRVDATDTTTDSVGQNLGENDGSREFDTTAVAPGTTSDVSTGNAGSNQSAATLPVTVSYGGADWTIVALESQDEDGGYALIADVRTVNTSQLDVSFPIEMLTLQTGDGVVLEADGIVGTGSRSISVDAGRSSSNQVVFESDRPVDLGDLTLTIAESDRIPERAPLDGTSVTSRYPVEAVFTGATDPIPLDESTGSLVTVEAIGAEVGLNGPGLRATTGERLVVVDVRVNGLSTNRGQVWIADTNFILDVDGTGLAPRIFVEETPERGFYASIEPGASETFTMVFAIQRDAVNLTLVVRSETGASGDELPVEIEALPDCCGE